MKRLVVILIALMVLAVTVLPAVTNKVAILPLKAYDSGSKYIQKILTKRDLRLTFDTHPKYDLMDMKAVEKKFKSTGYKDVEALELDEMLEVANTLETDLMIMGNITSSNPVVFRVQMRFFSPKSKELKSIEFNVGKDKNTRLKVLQDVFMVEVDKFISTEIEKMFNIAVNQYASENFAQAETSLLKVIDLNPEMKEAYYTLGATYNKMKKYDDAIRYLNRTLELEPNHLQALYTLADIYEATAQPLKRIEVLSKIAEINSDEELWFNIGNLYAENGDNVKAAESFRKALALKSDYGLAQYRLAFLLYDEGKFSEAIEYLEIAFNQFPDNDLIARRLAIAYQKAGRIDDAISKYETVMTNNPSNTQAYLNVVGLYRLKASEAQDPKVTAEMNTKAIAAMNKLKQVDPNNAVAYLNLASIYLTQNKPADAESNANLALSKDPNLYLPYVILATVSQTKGTEAYNRFVDLEQKAAKAVGSKANQLKKDRDAAKGQANSLFRKAQEQLQSARSRATDAEAINDINNRLSRISGLISQTSGY